MPFDPDVVGNKSLGDVIQSADWNALVEEVVAVNTRNVSKTGDSLSGPLSFGDTPTPMLYMYENNTTASRPVLALSPGAANSGLRIDGNTGRFHFQRAGAPVLTTDLNAERVGIKASNPAATLDIVGGIWNVSTTEGDLRIGSNTHRLKIGVVTAGGNAGDARIRSQGGTNRIMIGGANSDTLTVTQDGVGIKALNPAATLDIAGGIWNVSTTEGDLRIGSNTHRLKIGVVTAGGNAGDVRIRSQGGTNRIMIGGANSDTLTVTPSRVGIQVSNPAAPLHIAGGHWNVSTTEGDLRIGSNTYRLKLGVATGGAGAGDVRIRSQGGTNRIMIGGANSDTLTVTPSRVGIRTITPVAPLHLAGTNDVSLSNHGLLVLGNTNGENIAMDGNEIQARNNGAVNTLTLNHHGGNIHIATHASASSCYLRLGPQWEIYSAT